MKIGIDKLFPCVLIFLDVLAAAVYGGTGDIKKGIIFFVIAIILAAIVSFVFRSWIVNIIGLLYSLYAAYDAYQMAQ